MLRVVNSALLDDFLKLNRREAALQHRMRNSAFRYRDSPVPPYVLGCCYQVEGPSFHAVLRPLSGAAQVHLADVSLAWRADGGYTAVALLDVETAGRRECMLRMVGRPGRRRPLAGAGRRRRDQRRPCWWR
jgi:hypothetical protein